MMHESAFAINDTSFFIITGPIVALMSLVDNDLRWTLKLENMAATP